MTMVNRSVAFVHIIKNAGSSIHAAIHSLDNTTSTLEPIAHRTLHQILFYAKETLQMPVAAINNLRVIAVVRNPFDRAVSMYSFLTTTACYDERIHVCNGSSLGHGRHYHLTFEEWTSYIYSPSFSIRRTLLPQHPLSIRLHLMGNQLDYLRPTEHDVNESDPNVRRFAARVKLGKSGGSNVANEAATAWMSTTALRENGMDDDWVLNDNGTGTRNGRLLIFRFEEMRTKLWPYLRREFGMVPPPEIVNKGVRIAPCAYYSPRSRDLVADASQRDLDAFGYKFKCTSCDGRCTWCRAESIRCPVAPHFHGANPLLINKTACVQAELRGDYKDPACTGIARRVGLYPQR